MTEISFATTPQRQAVVAEQATSTVSFLAVVGFAVAALYLGREVFVPMALAILLSFVLAPLVRLLQNLRLGRALPVFVVVLLAFAAIFSLGGIMASQVTQLAGNLPQYQATIRDKIATIRGARGGGTLERAADVLQDLGKELDRSNSPGQASAQVPGAGRPALREAKPIPVEVRQPDPGTLETVRSLLAPLIHPMATTGIVIIFVIFIDVLLGDRPPLTAPETFYQRMLANDPGEAADQAEVYLKDRPLSAYYDDVALPGLVLAQRDATRGALDPARLGRMRQALTELIDDLADQTDVTRASGAPPIELDPGAQTDSAGGSSVVDLEVLTPDGLAPQWRGKAPVMCIGARSAIDDAAAAMLAQLLDKHGLNARLEKAEALGTANVFDLELSSVAMICVSSLDGANPAHLRYTIRRLRRRAPTAEILVGCWSLVGEAAAVNLRTAVRADFVATTLRDAVETCLGAASLPQITDPERAELDAA